MEKDYCVYKFVTMRRDVDNYKQVERYNRRQMWKILAIVFSIQVFVLLLIVLTAIILVKC